MAWLKSSEWTFAPWAAVLAAVMMAWPVAAMTPSAAEQRLMRNGSKILQRFDSVGGLRAIVADNGKEKRLFYVTPDGQALIAGLVFDAEGRNVTNDDLARAGVGNSVTGVSPAVARKVWTAASTLRAVADGRSGPIVYAFVDPTCPYCHGFMRTIRPHIAAGRVQVRWLPMALLSQSSKGLAEAMYRGGASEQVVRALADGKLTPLRETAEVRAALAKNLDVMRSTGYTSVPTLVYQVGGRVVITPGVPTDAQLQAMLRG